MNTTALATRPRRRAAFTLTELLVVLAIVTILLGLALPAFLSMSESQERTSSEARLGAAMLVGRDAAILGGAGADVGAVFTYELGGPTRVVACRKVGEFIDTQTRDTFEVFVPLDTVEPVSLPRGWTVRGYASPALMTPPANAASPHWYTDPTSPYTPGAAAWVFPETEFYDHTNDKDGENRQTFMVRFEGGTGKLVGATTSPALVMLPRPSSQMRDTTPSGQRLRADTSDDLRALAVTLLNDPTVPYQTKLGLIGPRSSDMVLTRPVQVLALADEADLAAELGARLDKNTDSLYYVPDADIQSGMNLKPQLVTDSVGTPLTGDLVTRAIESFDQPGGTATTRKAEQDVRLYSIDRYYGTLQLLPVTVNTP
jgi:prepilin-type N-terminal cleavage/methylation domain-containing protein